MILQFFDFQQGIRDNLVGDRMMAMLSGFFGVLAALLVVVGLYGVLSYFITQRRNEIGIRIALGAHRWQVIALVMRDTAAMLLLGVVFGTVLALLAGRAASTMLFGLEAVRSCDAGICHRPAGGDRGARKLAACAEGIAARSGGGAAV